MSSYRLKTLGSLALYELQGNAPLSIGKSKLSVLVVIAASGPAGVSRDRLATLFWPESDSDRSRNSLNQALFALRRATPAESVVEGTDILKLNESSCIVDFREFESLVANGHTSDAIAAYEGAFMDGVRVNDSPELEHWIEHKRTVVDGFYEKALRQAFDQASTIHDYRAMVDVAQRRAALLPYDAAVAESLVRVLCDSGNIELAKRHVAIYERLVSEDLGIAPDSRVASVLNNCESGLVEVKSAAAPSTLIPVSELPVDQLHADRAPAVIANSKAVPKAHRESTGARRSAIGRATSITGGALLVLVAVAAGFAWKNSLRNPPALNSTAETIAIFPFCVEGGGSDTDLSNGMVDLLGAMLPGDAGPRPLDPHTTISALRKIGDACQVSDSALRRIAASLGAARFISGNGLVADGNVMLSARVENTGTRGAVSAVLDSRGSIKDLHDVVGKLSAQILAVLINEPERRMPDILARSTPALNAYMRGRTLWRSGQKVAAVDAYITALEADSTFALAGLALAEAGGWTWAGEHETARRQLIRISSSSGRLSLRDKALLDALDGNPPHRRSALQVFDDWTRAVDLARDSPTAWYEYGDRLYHIGAAIGRHNSTADAKAAFDKAVSLDSSYTIPLGHLIEIAINTGDTSAVRKYESLYRVAGPGADYRQFIEWRIAEFFHDQTKLEQLKEGFGETPIGSLQRIGGISQVERSDPEFGRLALKELDRRGATKLWKFDVSVRLHDLAINDRDWRAAENDIRRFESDPVPPGYMMDVVSPDALRMTDIIFGGADTTRMSALISRLERSASNKPAGEEDTPRYLGENCVLGLWYAPRDTIKAHTFLQRTRSVRQQGEAADRFPANPVLCNAMIEAEEMVAHHAVNARATVTKLDSLSAIGFETFGTIIANFETARLYAALGDTENAVRAVRRRRYEWTEAVRYLTASRAFESRLMSERTARH